MTRPKKHLPKEHIHIYDLIFIISALSVLCFLFWKCRYGFGNNDESFYLTIPWRLAQGDALFLEEWHLSQMSGFLLLPFVAIYRSINGFTDGMILSFRHLCIFVQALCCLWYYVRLRRVSPQGALAASILALIYIPFNITALSYNSMGIFLLGLSTVTIATIDASSSVRVNLVFSGFAFAGAVLCCPYLIVVYAVAVLGLLAFAGVSALVNLHAAITARSKDILLGLFWFSAGAALLAVIFAVFVLSRASIADIVKAFPEIMNDPEHKSTAFSAKMISYGRSIYNSSSWSPTVIVFLGLLLGAVILDKKRKAHRPVYIVLAIAAVEMMLISINIDRRYINHLMYPVNLLSVFCLLLTCDRRSCRLFWGVVIPGMLYSVCIHFTSNQYFYVISSASTVSMLGSVTMLWLLVQEILSQNVHGTAAAYAGDRGMGGSDTAEKDSSVDNAEENDPADIRMSQEHGSDVGKRTPAVRRNSLGSALPIMLSLVLTMTLCGLLIYRRATHVFWESSMKTQTTTLDYGPQAGVITTAAKEQLYDRLMDAVLYIEEKTSAKSVLFLTEHTWMYLACPELRNSAYSAWLSGINQDSINKLIAYYRLNPAKLPDVIFADTKEEEYADILAEKLRYINKEYIPTGGCIYR